MALCSRAATLWGAGGVPRRLSRAEEPLGLMMGGAVRSVRQLRLISKQWPAEMGQSSSLGQGGLRGGSRGWSAGVWGLSPGTSKEWLSHSFVEVYLQFV